MTIFLYDDGASGAAIDMEELRSYCADLTGAPVLLRGPPVLEAARRLGGEKERRFIERAARVFARFRVTDPRSPASFPEPLEAEIAYEKRRLAGRRSSGIAYDGEKIQAFLAGLIPRHELSWDRLHVVATDQLLLTFDHDDLRYHARTVVLGYPSLLSVRGLVEGPARPAEFYIERGFRAALAPAAPAAGEAPQDLEGRFLTARDPRLTDVVKGSLAQAVFYQLAGETFCRDKGCRLYNARRQEELLAAQLGSSYEFCTRHERILESIRALAERS